MDSSNTDFTPKFYAVLGGTKRTDDAQSAKIFDGDETTAGLWNTVQKTNDYYGVDMGRVLNVTDISILQDPMIQTMIISIKPFWNIPRTEKTGRRLVNSIMIL